MFFLIKISIPDLIIIVALGILLTYLFYITFIKHRNEPCKGCSYAKNCKKLKDTNLKEKYQECKNKSIEK